MANYSGIIVSPVIFSSASDVDTVAYNKSQGEICEYETETNDAILPPAIKVVDEITELVLRGKTATSTVTVVEAYEIQGPRSFPLEISWEKAAVGDDDNSVS